jgi:putative pyoverdin transport system ATP-binding/permease protein
MTLLKFVLRTCRGMMILTAIASLASGACNAGLIALVNHVLNHPGAPAMLMVAAFASLGLGKVATGFVSQILLTQFSQGAIAELRRDLVRKILGVPLRHLENVGTARLMVALTEDVLNITQALLAIPIITVNIAVLAAGAAYLGWLSWQMLAVMGLFSLAGAFTYRFFINRGLHQLALAREEEDRLFGCFRGLTEGIKELKLHRNRRGVFLNEQIQSITETYQRFNVAAEVRFILAQTWSHVLIFAMIGLFLFLLPHLGGVNNEVVTGYIVTTFYLMGPLQGVLSSFSIFGRANVALQKIEALGVSLAATSQEQCPISPASTEVAFERLQLSSVTHAYHHEKEERNFTLGPIDLSFQPGEVVFIAGGNGSGKSTLAKIITGLYPPESGEIRLDGNSVNDANRDDYRQLFAAVFSDFYLFDTLIGLEKTDLDARAQACLGQLHLDHKVKVRDGVLSTTALSQGQRKRLALMTACLEDRPIYLFDEWASDQDPVFKDIFYTQIVPDLKARGKAVIAITHDDKYFEMADRLIKLDSGKIVFDKRLAGVVAQTSLTPAK